MARSGSHDPFFHKQAVITWKQDRRRNNAQNGDRYNGRLIGCGLSNGTDANDQESHFNS